jgi:predicted MFS family arabinose efflux permease
MRHALAPTCVAANTAPERAAALRAAAWRGLPLLIGGVVALNMAQGMYNGVFNNFAVGDLGIRPLQLGVVEAIRESSGLLCLVVAALAARIALPRLAAVALLLMGVGMTLTGHANTIAFLALASFVWGLGFHTFSPIQSTLSLQFAASRGSKGERTTRGGTILGQMNSVGALAGPVGTLLMLGLLPLVGGLRGVFLPAGAIAFAGGLALLFLRGQAQRDRPRWVVRRRYLPYYVLTLIDGGRKQILITFVVYAIVAVYHAPVQVVAVLLLCSSTLTLLAAPRIGGLIAARGERWVLLASGLLLVPIFAGYALTSSEVVMMVLYLADNALFTTNVALTTWVHRHAPEGDLAPTLAMGITINHVSSVLVPLVAGLLWEVAGYHVIFWGGVGIALLGVLFTLRLLPRGEAAALADAG